MTIEQHAEGCKQCARAIFDGGLNNYPLCEEGRKINAAAEHEFHAGLRDNNGRSVEEE